MPWLIQGASFGFYNELDRVMTPTWHGCQDLCIDTQECHGWYWWLNFNSNGMCSLVDFPESDWQANMNKGYENVVSCPAKECRSACGTSLS